MPMKAGFVLAQEMKLIRSDIPIILCTGVKENGDEEKCETAGINNIIMKPINKQEIAITIRKVLDEQRC